MDNYILSWLYWGGNELAKEFGFKAHDLQTIFRLEMDKRYDSWSIKKPDGGGRTIMSPTYELKKIQRILLDRLFSQIPVSPAAHGGVPGRSIITNARPHQNNRSMVCYDLEKAFDSTSFHREFIYPHVYGCTYPQHEFEIGGNMLLALAEIVDYVDASGTYSLPQGAPTSPVVFNLICRNLDKALGRLAGNIEGAAYTRYFDNICFSIPAERMDPVLQRAIARMITKYAPAPINRTKTRVISNGNRKEQPLRLPGVSIIEESLVVSPKTIKHLRMAGYCALRVEDESTIDGIRAFIRMVYGERVPGQLKFLFDRTKQEKETDDTRIESGIAIQVGDNGLLTW